VKLIVWDFDGTLVDSRPLIEAGMKHALEALNQPFSLMQEWLKYVGLPVEKGIERTFEGTGLGVDEVLVAYRNFNHVKHEETLIRPFEGVQELLAELRAHAQPMALATSKRQVPLQRQLTRFGWQGFFAPIITPDEVEQGKPHPESLQKIMAMTGLRPSELLMVGDTPFDLDMAKAAGVPSLAVGHGFYQEQELAKCGPKAYAPDTAALRDLLLAFTHV
jgi:HAD superfamily hydrolase (TIGR01509 family)